MVLKVSQIITNYVLTMYVMQITGMGAATTAAGTAANTNKSRQTQTEWTNVNGQKQTQTGECERGRTNANEGGQVDVNKSGCTRAGEWERANGCG